MKWDVEDEKADETKEYEGEKCKDDKGRKEKKVDAKDTLAPLQAGRVFMSNLPSSPYSNPPNILCSHKTSILFGPSLSSCRLLCDASTRY